MARPAKAWYWKARDGWYSTVGGKRVLLARGKGGRDEARKELHRRLGADPESPTSGARAPTVAELVDRFYDHACDHLKPATRELYRRRLREFMSRCGEMAAADVRPLHVNEWLATRAWSASTRRTAIIVVKRLFSWSAREGYLDRSPVAALEKPPERRRGAIPPFEAIRRMLEFASPETRDFLGVIAATGCRPGEAARVEAKDFDPTARTWTIEGKTTGKTGRMRVVYLPAEALAVCERRALAHPAGPMFLNTRGRPWSVRAYSHQVRRLRQKAGLGREAVAYAFRHAWITDALERGIPIATVAELVGHAGTTMISKHYSHLSDRADHLREAAGKVRPPTT